MSRLSHFLRKGGGNSRDTGRNGCYNTQWTHSPLNGVHEVGGKYPEWASNLLAPTKKRLSQESLFYIDGAFPLRDGIILVLCFVVLKPKPRSGLALVHSGFAWGECTVIISLFG